ncbi:MAG: CBM35 domain-containing protein [Polyangiaceae bacterium]
MRRAPKTLASWLLALSLASLRRRKRGRTARIPTLVSAPGGEAGPSKVTILLGAERGAAACGQLHGTEVATERAGYTGSGYVRGFDRRSWGVTVMVQIGRPGRYHLKIRYAAPDGDQHNKLLVNQIAVDDPSVEHERYDKFISFPKTTEWLEVDAGIIPLREGDNTLKLYAGSGGIEVDYFKLEPVE